MVVLHPLAVQHAPWVFGQGLGLHGALAVKVEPKGQSDLEMKAQPPAWPGMQQAPSGPTQGLGLQEPPAVKFPPMEEHSFLVAETQELARLQHAPAEAQGEVAQVAPEVKALEAGQLAAVVSKQTAVAVLQHAPVGPQLAAAQEVLANQEAEQADWTTKTHALAEQHAPSGAQGAVTHAALAVHVPVQRASALVEQPPF